MGVTQVTISRWENGQACPNKISLKALKALALSHPAGVSELPENNEVLIREIGDAYQPISQQTTPDFCGDPELVRLVVEAERLSSGYLFSPRFATETALIDPLPHQLIAVYQKMARFDLLSHRPIGEQRCIEVKGRRGVGDIELKENEWAKAANLRGQYWLYVVYDCAAASARLLRISDPFVKLMVRARGGVIIDEGAVFEATAP